MSTEKLTPGETIRRGIITPDAVERLLDQFSVPPEQRELMRAIVELHIKHVDEPRRFGQEARKLTETLDVDPVIAHSALIIYRQMNGIMKAMVSNAAKNN